MREAKIAADDAQSAHEVAKAARAHAKKYTQGPPLVPAIIVNRILDYIHKARLRKPRECLEKICRYWSLKREARRGAPLLKRLHLEVGSGNVSLTRNRRELTFTLQPWTASSASHEQTDAEKAKKLEVITCDLYACPRYSL
jgi:NuA3 HAT complex component NTO1